MKLTHIRIGTISIYSGHMKEDFVETYNTPASGSETNEEELTEIIGDLKKLDTGQLNHMLNIVKEMRQEEEETKPRCHSLSRLFDKTMIRFILVGIINTLVGTGVMFSFYNIFHFSYWVSSAANYIVGSIVSYFLNKYYTFENKERNWKIVARFVINISVCYLLAYGIAKPLAAKLLSSMPVSIQENGAMIVGMGLFVVLNYTGQRYFAFRKNEQ